MISQVKGAGAAAFTDALLPRRAEEALPDDGRRRTAAASAALAIRHLMVRSQRWYVADVMLMYWLLLPVHKIVGCVASHSVNIHTLRESVDLHARDDRVYAIPAHA